MLLCRSSKVFKPPEVDSRSNAKAPGNQKVNRYPGSFQASRPVGFFRSWPYRTKHIKKY